MALRLAAATSAPKTGTFAERLVERFTRVTPARGDEPAVILASPFVVNRKRRTIFFHNAKTGGSTIHRLLDAHGFDDRVLSSEEASFAEKRAYFAELAAEWDQYFKFTFVRNKFDLLVSLWHYDGRPGGTFAGFLENVVMPSSDIYDYWIDQHYLTVLDGQEVFDFYGRFEHYEHDLRRVFAHLGVALDDIPRFNGGSYDRSIGFRAYYDSHLADLVHRKFGAELRHFGFTL